MSSRKKFNLSDWSDDATHRCVVDFAHDKDASLERNEKNPPIRWVGTLRDVRELFYDDSLLVAGLTGTGIAARHRGKFLQDGANDRTNNDGELSMTITLSTTQYDRRVAQAVCLLMYDRGDEARKALEPLEQTQCVLLCAYLRMRVKRMKIEAPVTTIDARQ